MKRGRPPSGGSSRNADYYVKKFRPSKKGGTSIINYFKSVTGGPDKIDQPKEVRLDTENNKRTIESITPQPSSSSNTEICLTTNVEDAMIDVLEVPTSKGVTEKNAPVLESITENESDGNLTENDVEDIDDKHGVFDQRYIKTYEKAYNWLYYSHSSAGFLCKVCSMMSNTGPDKPWETTGVDIKKNGHPNRVCNKHELSKKHKQAVMAQELNKKKGIMTSISEGAEAANLTKKNFNRNVISKFVKILYFMIKKQWAVSDNFESLVRFLGANLDDEDIKKHLQSCGKNATYLSHISVESIVNSISTLFEQELLAKLACADFFTLMADECTDESQREQLGLIVRYRLPGDCTVQEKYFGLINLRNSSAESITGEIEKICIAKHVEISKCLFIALDGARVMSGEHSGVQRRIKHLSPHCNYINCRNHKLALIFVHLLKMYDSLKAVDSLLISLWKLFHYSPKKTAVFKEIQHNVYCIDVLKILKVSTTRWLSHGHACERVASRYEQLLEALDTLFVETREPELKGLREQLLDPKILLTILFLADFLGKVDVFNLWLQSTDIVFSSLNSKVDSLMKEVSVYCENLEDGHCFKMSKDLLNLSNECTSFSTKLRGRSHSKDDVLKEFKEQFVRNFLQDFKTELHLAFDLPNSCNNLKGFEIFNNVPTNELTDDEHFDSCLSLLISFYGEEMTDNFQGAVTVSTPIIDTVAIQTEKEGFKKEMLFAKMTFDIEKTKAAQQLLYQDKKEEAKKAMESKMHPNELQMILEREAKNWILYPNFMKLLSLCTIMPTSTASVERLFSKLNLLCTDMRTSLKQETLDRHLRILVNGPQHLSKPQCEEVVDIFKMSGNRRLLL